MYDYYNTRVIINAKSITLVISSTGLFIAIVYTSCIWSKIINIYLILNKSEMKSSSAYSVAIKNKSMKVKKYDYCKSILINLWRSNFIN